MVNLASVGIFARAGAWADLRKALASAVYDGATDLADWTPEPTASELLLVSDGLQMRARREAAAQNAVAKIIGRVLRARSHACLDRLLSSLTAACAAAAFCCEASANSSWRTREMPYCFARCP